MFRFQTVDPNQCSPHINISDQKCSIIDGPDDTIEFVYLTIPPLDADGCYSISLNASGVLDSSCAGFGMNRSLSCKANEDRILILDKIAHV